VAKTIFFDARYIRVDHHDGISRFSAGLATALAAKAKVIALISDPRQLESLPTGIDFRLIHAPTSALEPFTALKLNRLGAEIVFSPMQTIGSFGRKFKLVLTLHDLIYYRHPTPPPSMSLPVRIGWRIFHLSYGPQRRLLNAADAVATVSQTTADLIAEHHLTKRPVKVVYNAAGSHALDGTQRTLPVGEKNLVYMGSFMGYKNVETLIGGLGLLPECKLHLLSRITPKRKAELTKLAAENAERVVFHNGVTDEEYSHLLANAFALVSASFDEGFGIPLAEAMSHGTPVVVSDMPIFHEIADGAGTYFSAADAEGFAASIRSIESEAEWLAKSRAGLAQVQRFNWDKSADALLEVLEQI
jgi:glycosyltransferase involved in cell wall biosynthesis